MAEGEEKPRPIRVRNDGSIRVARELLDSLEIYPGSKVIVTREGSRVVIEKFIDDVDPFERAVQGPDTSAIEKIREKQRREKERAKDKFEDLLAHPPEYDPEDNPDLWR